MHGGVGPTVRWVNGSDQVEELEEPTPTYVSWTAPPGILVLDGHGRPGSATQWFGPPIDYKRGGKLRTGEDWLNGTHDELNELLPRLRWMPDPFKLRSSPTRVACVINLWWMVARKRPRGTLMVCVRPSVAE